MASVLFDSIKVNRETEDQIEEVCKILLILTLAAILLLIFRNFARYANVNTTKLTM